MSIFSCGTGGAFARCLHEKSWAVKLKVQISQKVGGNFTDNSHFSSLFIVKRKFINAEDKSINCIYC